MRNTTWLTLVWGVGTAPIVISLAISFFAPVDVQAQLANLSAAVGPVIALVCWVGGLAPLVILCLICADVRPCLFEAMKMLVACALAIGGVWSVSSEIAIGTVMLGLALYLAIDAILALRELDPAASGETLLIVAAAAVAILEIAVLAILDVGMARASYLLSAMPLAWVPFVGLALYNRRAAQSSEEM